MEIGERDIPFFANAPEGTHCFQAALKMVLKCFRPEQDYSWAALEAITEKPPGRGSWPFAGLTWLSTQGFEVRNIELMDNRRFALEGRRYLAELFGPEYAEATGGFGDLARERAAAEAFVDTVDCETRAPTVEDIRRHLAAGYLVVCNVNSRVLNGQQGYLGHFVVVKGCRPDALVVHDPGPPGVANREVALEVFEAAWAFPTAVARNVVAIRDGR